MKKLLSIFLSLVLSISVLGVCNISFAAQTTDIEPTKLINSSAYYSFDANTKTLTISGKGRTPNFTNSSGDTTSQPWFYWKSDGSIEHIVVEDGITSLGNYFFTAFPAPILSLPTALNLSEVMLFQVLK